MNTDSTIGMGKVGSFQIATWVNGQSPHLKIKSLLPQNGIGPEEICTIGAMISRNPEPLEKKLEAFTPKTKERIMGVFYNKYGHNSIGELGEVFFAIEGISMQAAQLIIDFPRFRGQEASTRYIDFTTADPQYILPSKMRDNKAVKKILDGYLDLYAESIEVLLNEYVEQDIPLQHATPRALDIAGAFLPASATTSIVVVCDIRNLVEHAWNLQSYTGKEEVREIGNLLLSAIKDLCPNSVKERTSEELFGIQSLRNTMRGLEQSKVGSTKVSFDKFETEKCIQALPSILNSRISNPETDLFGIIEAEFTCSFRSFRDFSRHRMHSKVWRWNRDNKSFTDWYIQNLPNNGFRRKVVKRLGKLNRLAHCAVAKYRLDENGEEDSISYMTPMGNLVNVKTSATINNWLYVLKLRSSDKVHPEVREIVHSLIHAFAKELKISNQEVLGDMGAVSYEKRSKDAKTL